MVSVAAQFVVVAACLASLATAIPSERSEKVASARIYRPKVDSRPIKDLIQREKARISSFATKASGTAPIINGDESYYADTTVGSQTFTLLVDTGSSNTWVGADQKFTKGSATDTSEKVAVTYGSGHFSGTEYIDTVSLGGLTASKQSIGVASTSAGFPEGVDGIIGFGPLDLTENTVKGAANVPTFMDTLVSEGVISSNVLGVSFVPESGSDTDDENGELDFGGVDSAKYTGSITYADITSTEPYNGYWGVEVTSLKYSTTSLESSASAIVDTGTTFLYIPSSAFSKLLSATDGESYEGLASWTKKPTADVTYTIGGTALTLTPAQYLMPTDQYDYFGVPSGKYYGWFIDGGAEAADINYVIGQKFLENYYSVFDADNSRVGFATSSA